jgi:hypothetical protein
LSLTRGLSDRGGGATRLALARKQLIEDNELPVAQRIAEVARLFGSALREIRIEDRTADLPLLGRSSSLHHYVSSFEAGGGSL